MSANLTCPTDPGSGLRDTVDGQIPRPTANDDPINESKTELSGDSGVEETAIPELLDASPADVLISKENGTQDDLEHLRYDLDLPRAHTTLNHAAQVQRCCLAHHSDLVQCVGGHGL